MEGKIILGIDPGSNIMGYGVIQVSGSKIEMITMGVVELKKYEGHFLKLQKIFERTMSLIEQFKPDEIAIEAPFYGKNIQSMLKLGRAQGAAIAAGLHRSIPIFEYAPRKIKQSITGAGAASKEMVATMLSKMLKFKEIPKHLDATDGLAAAVCHSFQHKTEMTAKKTNSWDDFISKNPNRVK